MYQSQDTVTTVMDKTIRVKHRTRNLTKNWNEWVSDCCLTPIQQFFSYIMARTSYFLIRCLWGLLCWIFIVLAHWNNSLRLGMSPYSDTLSWFRANQSLVWPDRGLNPWSTALDASTLTITPPMRMIKNWE